MSTTVYEEVALAEMTYDDSEQVYYYECPCGDKFEISLEDLYDGEDIAPCPSCTLQIKVIFKEVCTVKRCFYCSEYVVLADTGSCCRLRDGLRDSCSHHAGD